MLRADTKLGSTLLLTGTSIGAAMLTLPIVASPSGLLGALLILLFAWCFMYYTGLLTLQANLPLPPGSNFLSMTRSTLGVSWSGWIVLTTVVYIGLFYALIAAYFSAIVDFTHLVFRIHWHGLWGHVLMSTLIMSMVVILLVFGMELIDRCNRFLMYALVIAFVGMLLTLFPHAHTHPVLLTTHWHSIWTAIPVVMTAFGFHVLIPSVRVYMASDRNALSRVIFWGCTIPLVIYLLWMLVLFFTLPTSGQMSLPGLLQSSMPEVQVLSALSHLTHATTVVWFAHIFILCAILTSLLGIAMAMLDFFRYEVVVHLPMSSSRWQTVLSLVLTFLPPWFFASFYPHGFLLALEFSGLFVLYLHGVLPLAMVWVLQRRMDIMTMPQWTPRQRWSIVLGLFVSVVLIVGQVLMMIRSW